MKILLIRILDWFRKFISHLITLYRNENKDFTIISNDCWGAELYIETNIQYRTPFVGLMVMAPCYIKLLQKIDMIKTEELKFINNSKYDLDIKKKYPIGLLDDVEIHFLHYKDEQEAKAKWDRRTRRINWNNLFIKFDGSKDFATREHLKLFDNLPFEKKVCFVREALYDFTSTIKISEWNPDGKVMYRNCKKEFDVIAWINNKQTSPGKISTYLYHLLDKPL